MKCFKFGLGWDTRCDVDASIILFDKNGERIDTIYYGHLSNHDRSVVHSGDNLTGEGDGDDEVITVNLSKMNQNVFSIWPVITIYSGDT